VRKGLAYKDVRLSELQDVYEYCDGNDYRIGRDV
jgi:hypothetical protein